ncbi:DinB family protein [Oceanospirillum sediminis]|uniref:DinB family protein n=1 Tax=Oceanospirillum sediminis TaxID=2760088 RepID=A0A839IQ97_9GAMM|nr:DinB family protein [Oceanospirillum sediminis]MBB1487425.1 DinB family protein [Oceanospirillum sediminis]
MNVPGGGKAHFDLLADYNRWMNGKLYQVVSELTPEQISEHRGAFFGSVLGTLNHIMVGDILWLQRFSCHPACTESLKEVALLPRPSGLDQILFEDFQELKARRSWLDEQICNWIQGLTGEDLDYVLSYRNSRGIPASKNFSALVLHFFNHQTHHRGQVSTLLSQLDKASDVTDLLMLIPDSD